MTRSKISVLSEAVANQIAAGEVVERPSSIVKELIENAIDAGAKKITVEVRGGGRAWIQVIDDGGGMTREDAELSFKRHATSKLHDTDDLSSIRTLGFRGEALPSIGSVARVRLETQTREQSVGTEMEVAAGNIVSLKEAAFPSGTQVTVEDVFYNVPARRKFLKSETYELSQITAHCTRFALAFPAIHFTFRSGNFEVLSAPPALSRRDRILQVFGRDLLDDLVECEKEFQGARIRVHVFTSRPHVQKYNRNSMYFFVNGRAVREPVLWHACAEAYRNILPSGTFPITILYLRAPYRDIDVNVHPAKTEIRFRRSSLVHDAVRDTLTEALKSDKTIIPMGGDTRPTSPHLEPGFTSRVPESWSSTRIARDGFSDSPIRLTYSDSRSLDLDFESAKAVVGAGTAAENATRDFDMVRSEIRPLGQLQESFIVASDASGLVVIDQHVAHERVLFEDYVQKKKLGDLDVQRLLTPIVLELSPEQAVKLENLQPELDQNGFEIEPFGPRTVAVKTAPAILKAGDVEKLLREIIDGLDREDRALSMDDFQRKIAATVACHAAIKINNPLDSVKMRWLVAELMKTDCPTVCPHGRPIIIRYDVKEIQKAFKRV